MGNRIRALLRRRKRTIADLANAIGVAVPTAHHYVTGYTAPTDETAAKIAAFLEVSPDDLSLRDRGKVGNRPGPGFIDADKLRDAMKLKGLSIKELAELSGAHFQRLYAYAGGRAKPSAATLGRIAKALSVEPDSLLMKP